MLNTITHMASETWLDLISNSDEELHVSSAFTVELSWSFANIIRIVKTPSALPDKPGIYVIYSGAQAHYVGISERNLRSRFRNRLRIFREFDVDVGNPKLSELLKNRTVIWATIKNITGPRIGGVRQGKKGFKGLGQALIGTSGVLKVLELHLIKELGTLGKGNIHREDVIFKKGGVINVKRITGSMRDRFPNKLLTALDSSINTNIRW